MARRIDLSSPHGWMLATFLSGIAEGRSCRWIARDLYISKNTVADIARRERTSGE